MTQALRARVLSITAWAIGIALLACAAVPAAAQQPTDRAAERAVRRAQQQAQALQQQLDQASAERAKAQQERETLARQLAAREQAAVRAGAAQRSAVNALRETEQARDALQARVAALEAQLVEQRAAAESALAAKDRELASAGERQRGVEGERDGWQQRFVLQARSATECSDKNDRLVALGAELLERWRRKGVTDALREREPLLGLRDVEMFNLVQDYRDRVEASRFVPGAAQP